MRVQREYGRGRYAMAQARGRIVAPCRSCAGRRPASPGGRARGLILGRPAPVDLDADTRRYREAIERLRVSRA
jgi:hypothetical protein